MKQQIPWNRLLAEGTEILETGNLRYPLSDELVRDLQDIRAGKKEYEEVEMLFNDYEAEIKAAADNSQLPDKVNMERVNQLFLDLTLKF